MLLVDCADQPSVHQMIPRRDMCSLIREGLVSQDEAFHFYANVGYLSWRIQVLSNKLDDIAWMGKNILEALRQDPVSPAAKERIQRTGARFGRTRSTSAPRLE